MKAILAVALFASLGKTCNAVCGDRQFGGCDKSRGLCWDANDPKPTTFCTCKAGYKFLNPQSRKGRCVDINECKTGAHACDTVHGRCVNTFGSHYCTCRRGYVLDFTKTKCLRKTQITGLCGSKSRCKRFADFEYEEAESPKEEADARDMLLQFFLRSESDGEKRRKCGCNCDTGYTRCGMLCKDINECRLKRSKCDLKNGYCHNSIGGYFCSCKKGFLLGPCGFKCYRPKLRPEKCTSKNHMANSLVRTDSNGLNDEASLALVLDADTEKAALRGKINSVFKTKQGGPCIGKGTTTEKFDINRDGKIDVIIHYACISKVWVVKSIFNSEAFWTQWTCWTECKATCHGGIQTRTRYCKNGLVGEGRCKGPATQSKTCYKGRKCPLRVRRNAKGLTNAQKRDLVQAFRKYKADTTTNGFWAAAGTHVFPLQCSAPTGGPGACCYHGARLNFVTWHRAELLNFEEGLAKYLKDKRLGLPYWNWLDDDTAPSLVWDKRLFGRPNPFAGMVIRHDLNPPAEIVRADVPQKDLVVMSRNSYFNTAIELMQSHNIHEFSEALENSHNTIHAAVCPDWPRCHFSMSSLTYTAYDPIFFFHHTNVDRLFAKFQKYMHNKGETAWTRQSVLEPQESIYHFNEPYNPFRNKTLTSFKKLNTLSTIENVFYYEELLGYTYDTLSPSSTKKGDSEKEDEKEHIPNGVDAVNIMQYERSLGMNVRVSFFIDGAFEGRPPLPACKHASETDERFVTAILILGSKAERSWKARQPTLKSMDDWIAKNFTRSANTNFKLKACYSSLVTCVNNCAQVPIHVSNKLPSPQLMFYPKNIRADLLKFRWDSNIRLPTWTINIKAVTAWLHFWGKKSGNIYQVPSSSKYRSCSLVGAKKIDCSGSCILTSGHHYFIHGNKASCKAGLKMKVLATL